MKSASQPRHLLSIDDLSTDDITAIMATATRMSEHPHMYTQLGLGKLLSLVFLEPSTRTYFSFSSAMHRLGGNVMGFHEAAGTSLAKGESVEDTLRIMSYYTDVMVMRSKEKGFLQKMAGKINIPLINAGDGDGEHPTQTLLDMFTILKECGKLDVTVGLYGDLKYGRTNHSLIKAMSRFGANFHCIAPEQLQMPEDYIKAAEANGSTVALTNNIHDVLDKIDVLYVSRLQTERLPEGAKADAFTPITQELVDKMRERAPLLHPLPRVGEIAVEVDENPRAAYFKQVQNSVPVRMAILARVLELEVKVRAFP